MLAMLRKRRQLDERISDLWIGKGLLHIKYHLISRMVSSEPLVINSD